MRFQTRWIVLLAAGCAALVGASCHGGGATSPADAGTFEAGDEVGDASEAPICMQFSQAGDPCPSASPVRCFPQCDSGGCSCVSLETGAPPVWVCRTDLSCVPDGPEAEDAAGATEAGDGGDAAPD